jgi:hypothetical protein
MWSGVRRDGPGGISKSAENDLAVALGIEPPRLDGSESRFELSAVPEGEPWPAARRGAVLVCTGFGLSGGKPCDNLCPKGSDVEIPPGGRDDGALLLVGGEGEGGPLDDVWIYRGAGGAVRDGEGSGWRLAGHLPGIAGGLTEPGTVQLGRTLWLVGGRTAVGPSADVWRVDVDSGEAERLVTTGAALPSGRVSPAVTYDPIGRRILVFGGTDASGAGRTDLWALDPETSSWAQLAPACSGYGCPAVTGRELLVLDPVSGDVTVVADRGAETGSWVAWTLRGGVWKTRDETIAEATGLDCDEDGASEAMAGLPCDTGSGGFPDRGTLLCGGSDLVCRPPAAAGRLVVEYAMPMLRAGVGRGLEFFAARGRWVEVYRVGSDGHLSLDRSYVLRHPANDLAIAGSLLLAADARGLVVMDRDSGRRLSAVDTCGVARRVFAAGRATAIVVGLRRVTVVGLEDPSSPVVRADVELAPDWSRLTVRPGGRCPRGIEALERFWEALSPCGGGGRDVAAYGDGLLFLNLLGTTYVLELGREGGPAVVGRVATGMIKDTRYHDGRLFANTLWGSGVVVGPDGSESWRQEGTHEMNRWVQGTADVGGYSIWWGPGRLQVGTRQ